MDRTVRRNKTSNIGYFWPVAFLLPAASRHILGNDAGNVYSNTVYSLDLAKRDSGAPDKANSNQYVINFSTAATKSNTACRRSPKANKASMYQRVLGLALKKSARSDHTSASTSESLSAEAIHDDSHDNCSPVSVATVTSCNYSEQTTGRPKLVTGDTEETPCSLSGDSKHDADIYGNESGDDSDVDGNVIDADIYGNESGDGSDVDGNVIDADIYGNESGDDRDVDGNVIDADIYGNESGDDSDVYDTCVNDSSGAGASNTIGGNGITENIYQCGEVASYSDNVAENVYQCGEVASYSNNVAENVYQCGEVARDSNTITENEYKCYEGASDPIARNAIAENEYQYYGEITSGSKAIAENEYKCDEGASDTIARNVTTENVYYQYGEVASGSNAVAENVYQCDEGARDTIARNVTTDNVYQYGEVASGGNAVAENVYQCSGDSSDAGVRNTYRNFPKSSPNRSGAVQTSPPARQQVDNSTRQHQTVSKPQLPSSARPCLAFPPVQPKSPQPGV
ncbi:dentin sialophosphoprotein-like [Sycon ciliatum]|uniref:dentin sialophosphoprotein-like n=1 Tax=Sycon ciliatum TaxID=27933 RepID=UPI0031F6B00E